ncbi:MAG: hypothetical protein Q8P51_17810, partial [Ignavibacteria bacterium]|nr:hypothetical protein [Ignavibacteria bacterium]
LRGVVLPDCAHKASFVGRACQTKPRNSGTVHCLQDEAPLPRGVVLPDCAHKASFVGLACKTKPRFPGA